MMKQIQSSKLLYLLVKIYYHDHPTCANAEYLGDVLEIATREGEFSQENFIDEFGRKQGKWIAKYDNGTIRYKGDFKDDKPQGIFYFYYDNGNLHITQDFFHDGSAAATHIYYKYGFLKAAGLYIN